MKKTLNTEWLIDLMENELSQNHKQDMKLYVRNSQSAMQELQSLQTAKNLVKKSEPQIPDISEAMLARIHTNVMAGVKNAVQESPARSAPTFLRPFKPFIIAAAVACAVIVSGVVLWQVVGPRISIQPIATNPETQNTDMLLAISLEVPEAFADSLILNVTKLTFI